MSTCRGVGRSENEIVRLKSHDFFQIHLGAILRGFNDRISARFAQGIGYEGIFANGNKRFSPNDEEHARLWNRSKFRLKGGKPVLKLIGQIFPGSGTPRMSASFSVEEMISVTVCGSTS